MAPRHSHLHFEFERIGRDPCLQKVTDVLHLLERHPRFVYPPNTSFRYAVDQLAQENTISQGLSEWTFAQLVSDSFDPGLHNRHPRAIVYIFMILLRTAWLRMVRG